MRIDAIIAIRATRYITGVSSEVCISDVGTHITAMFEDNEDCMNVVGSSFDGNVATGICGFSKTTTNA